jgi:hypothetical protein
MKTTPTKGRTPSKAADLPPAALWPFPGPVHGKAGLERMTDGTTNPAWPANAAPGAKAKAKAALKAKKPK